MKHRLGFTLIELLVVISIILTLAGLILGAAGVIRESAKHSRTTTIMSLIQQGLAVWAADKGGLPTPAEHPLAGSKAPRAAWVRAAGTALTPSGMALVGVELSNLPVAYRTRLLLPDDRFADAKCPALFGLRRTAIGLLGTGMADVTAVKVLPTMPTYTAQIADPDAAGAGRLVAPTDAPSASEKQLRYLMGKGSAFDELSHINALWSPADDDVAKLAANGRVYSLTKAALTLPGTMTVTDVDGPQRYRLRGLGIYDAWGNEVLYILGGNGRNAMFVSAGKDGHFRFSPGKDGVFQTLPEADAPSGDDRDASTDNITIGGR